MYLTYKGLQKMKPSNIAFKASPTTLVDTLPKKFKPVAKFISMQEGDTNLSHIRFVQDTFVNLFPKAIFSRSAADLSEMSLLELSESVLVYYFPKLLGENVFRKLYSKKLPENLKRHVADTLTELAANKNLNEAEIQKLKPIKAAISLSTLAVPLTEFSLNYIKNLFTLKVFNQADFNNIANLNKDKNEEIEKQKRVKKSAINHLKLAAGLFAGCLGVSALLVRGKANSKLVNSISDMILTPGNKLFSKNAKKAETFNKYFSLEFSNNNGVLGLSRGQLTSCVVAGAFGYLGAAKDRGKQNFLEVLFRYPLVGFYVITGSEMFEKGFKSILHKKGIFKETLSDNLSVPKLAELGPLAEKLAKENGSHPEEMFKKLFKQKATIVAVPFLFSLGFMGMFVAGMSRFFTQYRYNQDVKKAQNLHQIFFGQKSIDEFKTMIKN